MADFSRQTSDLTAWCGWIKNSIIAVDGTVVPSQGDSTVDKSTVRARWEQVRADCLVYHSLIEDTQARYGEMLPQSTRAWQQSTILEAQMRAKEEAKSRGKQQKLGTKLSNIFLDAIRQLSCHSCLGCFAT
ncbi:hypothetical protein H0H81_009805 [Sphagnurus paluster]|uniref:Uncharacterized protein n=1 Tax=Sphagnurus paluster TaxID=117069 RepID=A0A9P7KI00_9AGAR|nr:hypothetical protein H0H81_009805 [Sphagnurus paluster]